MNKFSGGLLSSMGTCVGLKSLLRGQNFQDSTAVKHNSRLIFTGLGKTYLFCSILSIYVRKF